MDSYHPSSRQLRFPAVRSQTPLASTSDSLINFALWKTVAACLDSAPVFNSSSHCSAPAVRAFCLIPRPDRAQRKNWRIDVPEFAAVLPTSSAGFNSTSPSPALPHFLNAGVRRSLFARACSRPDDRFVVNYRDGSRPVRSGRSGSNRRNTQSGQPIHTHHHHRRHGKIHFPKCADQPLPHDGEHCRLCARTRRTSTFALPFR